MVTVQTEFGLSNPAGACKSEISRFCLTIERPRLLMKAVGYQKLFPYIDHGFSKERTLNSPTFQKLGKIIRFHHPGGQGQTNNTPGAVLQRQAQVSNGVSICFTDTCTW